MSPLIFVTIGVILVFTPLSVLASIFLYRLYRQDKAKLVPQRIAELEQEIAQLRLLPAGVNPEPNRFLATLVVMAWSRTVAALLLAVPTVLFVAGIAVPWSGQLILVSLDILLITNVMVAGYLWWLDR